MRQDHFDSNEDLVNPLTPWRSMAVIFVGACGAVLLDALDVPGRYGGRPGFNPIFLALPFVAVVAYSALWTAWRLAQHRYRRQSRERRAMLGRGRLD